METTRIQITINKNRSSNMPIFNKVWLKHTRLTKSFHFFPLSETTIPILCVVLANRVTNPTADPSWTTALSPTTGAAMAYQPYWKYLYAHTNTCWHPPPYTHTHTHGAKAHNHTNKHTHSITLIRLLSLLHLYQTKHAAADDSVSTTRMPGPV